MDDAVSLKKDSKIISTTVSMNAASRVISTIAHSYLSMATESMSICVLLNSTIEY